MNLTPNLMKGFVFSAPENTTINNKNFDKVLELAKIEDIKPWPLKRGNYFDNPNAEKKIPNQILIFEFEDTPGDYSLTFRGFLFPNGKIVGKFKHHIDAKIDDEKFEGIYKVNKNGNLLIFGEWRSNRTGIDSYFIELFYEKKQ
jgi:hypothetical protein